MTLTVKFGWKEHDDATGRQFERVPVESLKLAVSLRNRGMGSIQINELGIRVPGFPHVIVLDSIAVDGPAPPLKLEGFHGVEWSVQALELARSMRKITGGSSSDLSVVVHLGDGRDIESKTMPVAPYLASYYGGRLYEACRQVRSEAVREPGDHQ